MRTAVYPGTFDPVTNGHLDVIRRAAALFDRLVVGVAVNLDKEPIFTVEERVEMLREELADLSGRVDVCAFEGLAVDLARREGAGVLVRGIRNVTDFDYEFAMALTNRDLAPSVETLFLLPSVEFSYVSGRLVRESVAFGGDVSHLVPPRVLERLRRRIARRAEGGEE